MNNEIVVNNEDLYEITSDLGHNYRIAVETGDGINPKFSGAVNAGLMGNSINIISNQMSSISNSIGNVSNFIDDFSTQISTYDDTMASKIEEIEIPEDFLAEDSAQVNSYLQTLASKIDGKSVNEGDETQSFDISDNSVIEASTLKEFSAEDAYIEASDEVSDIEKKEDIENINENDSLLNVSNDYDTMLQDNFMLIDMIPREIMGTIEYDDSTLIKDESINDMGVTELITPHYEDAVYSEDNVHKVDLENANNFDSTYQLDIDNTDNYIDQMQAVNFE